ncbi:MAG: class I SAM-dependent methyltransferase [Alphaproteobacteria bacterium]
MKFYDSGLGVLVRDMLQQHISQIWPDVHGYRILGCGYAVPYMEHFLTQNPERVIAMMPKKQGVRYWPAENKNLSFFCSEDSFPIETASIDRVLLVHHLEGCDDLRASVREIWRVLKADGKALIIAPNRTGVWTHGERTPFGHGRPFTMMQLQDLLCCNLFEQSHYTRGLFVPPVFDLSFVMRLAPVIERLGGSLLPFACGVHILEVRKRVFAGVDKTGGGSAVLAKTKAILGGKGVIVPQGYIPPTMNSR